MSMTPILYTPRSAYTSDTKVWVPLLEVFAKGAVIAMLEWVSLRFVESAPTVVWLATGVFALAVLAVLERKDWLVFKGRPYFLWSILSLFGAWIGISAYGFWAYPPQDKIIPTFPTADEIAEAIARTVPRVPTVTPATPTTQTVSSQEKPPEYLRQLNFDPVNLQGIPLQISGIPTLTVPSLAIYADYSFMPDSINWGPKIRVPLGEISKPVKDMPIEHQIIFRGSSKNTDNDLWVGDPALNYPLKAGLGNLSLKPIYLRVVIIGPSGEEQHQDTFLLRADPSSDEQLILAPAKIIPTWASQ